MFGPDLTCPGTKVCSSNEYYKMFCFKTFLFFFYRCTSSSVTRIPRLVKLKRSTSKSPPGPPLKNLQIFIPSSFSKSQSNLYFFSSYLINYQSPNNTYNVLFNGESDKTGSLLEDFEPAVNPSKEIDDPSDKKPEDWVDEQKISDPDAKKVRNRNFSRL